MWATLALSAITLAPAQAGTLELKNVRVTSGVLGQERKDTKFLPGDVFVVSFDIDGLKVRDDGRVRYSMGMELTREGKPRPVFAKAPEDKEALLHLGGNSLPMYALSVIGTDTEAGNYTMTVTITDLESKQTQKLVKGFEVLKPTLGFVRVGLTYETGQPAPPVAVPGQSLLLNFALVGFELKNGNPDIAIEMRILDEAGKPTLVKPFKGEVKTVAKTFQQIIPFDALPIQLNRAGKYQLILKATDNLTRKDVEQTLNLTIIDPARTR